ncbi:MAG TPA: Hsp20/alpha crystallin family protein [Chloroflexota bacterium]|nr:Hsp20/alpha crystallin family protein [Chloroflexota bacterium]
MTLPAWSPIEELAQMRQEIHSAMRQAPGWPVLLPWADDDQYFIPAVDVVSRGEDLIFRLELPGVDPTQDVNVSVEGRKLHVSGRRHVDAEQSETAYYFQGMSYGRFDRTFTLQDDINEKAITAEYNNGVLEVKVAGGARRSTTPKGTSIPVKVPEEATPQEPAASESGSETVNETRSETGSETESEASPEAAPARVQIKTKA